MAYHIMININDAYVQHCCVMLCSLFENNKNQEFYIHIFSFDISSRKQLLLENFIKKYKNNVRFYILSLPNITLPNIVPHHHVSKETYLRLFAPMYLDKSIKKILYLDVDILVLKAIDELYSTDLKDKLIAAIEDYPLTERNERLHIPQNYSYFNAGVMLINLTLWHQHKITEQAIKILTQNNTILTQHDQDVLNMIAYDKWIRLPFKWNVLDIFFYDYSPYKKTYQEEIAHLLNGGVGIMHFAGPIKPWTAWTPNPYYQYYYKFLSKTPWKGYKPSLKSQWKAYPFPRNLMTILKLDRILIPLKRFIKKDFTRNNLMIPTKNQ